MRSRYALPQRILLSLLVCAALQGALRAGSDGPKKTECAIIVKVVDGDTFEIVKADGTTDKVRLIGMDCPEAGRNPKLYRDGMKEHRDIAGILEAGRLATDFVRSILKPGDPVDLEYDVQLRDKYRRVLAYVYLEDGRMINRILLEKGYASLMTMPPNVKYAEEFLAAFRSGRNR